MRNALALHELNRSNNFSEKCPRAIFAEFAQILANLKKQATCYIFHDDVHDLLFDAARSFDNAAIVTEVVDSDNIFVF